MKRIPLTNSDNFALVDNDQYDRVEKKKWFETDHGHVWSTTTPHIFLHIFLFGKAPKGLEWDHKNRSGLDNQKHNLRLGTHSQNIMNVGLKKNNKSGYIGVRFRHKKWSANIRLNRIKINVGRFKTAIEAAHARDAAAFRHYGKFAVLNFPIQRFPR